MRTSLTWLLCLFSIVVAAETDYKIESRENGRLLVTVIIPTPTVQNMEGESGRHSRINLDGWSTADDGLPYLSILLHLPAAQATAAVLTMGANKSLSIFSPWFQPDQPLGLDTTLYTGNPMDRKTSSSGAAYLHYLGLYQAAHIWALRMAPFRYESGLLTWPENMVVEIVPTVSGAVRPIAQQEKEKLQQLGAASIANQTTTAVVAGALSKTTALTGPQIKIFLNEDGIYRITGNDLKAAGVDLAEVDIKKMRLTCADRQIPIYLFGRQDGRFGAEDYFEFWGESLRRTRQTYSPELYQDPFTQTNVYWLSWSGSAGIWMGEEEAGLTTASYDEDWQTPYSYYETVHVEQDNYFDRLNDIQTPDSLRDLWFFDSGISSNSKKEYSFATPWPDAKSSLGVKVNVWISGRSTQNAAHQVSVFLNDLMVLSGTGYRQELLHLLTDENQLPPVSALGAGNNNLTIINQVDDKNIDFVMLDWFEVVYPRLYRAFNDFLKFSIPPDYDLGAFRFQLDGFSDQHVDIYKLGAGRMIGYQCENKISSDGLRSFSCTFQDQVFSRDTWYVAVTQKAKKKPLAIEFLPSPWQLDQVNVDYLIIGARRFLHSAALQKLIAHRQAQGLATLAVSVEEMYDAFDYGRYGSAALKKGLTWFYQQSPRLKYVLLVGDGCYQRNTPAADSLDLVPVHYRQTVRYGATASDNWYALLVGNDDIPDVHVGRLPVRKEEELEVLVGKIISQETNPDQGDWRNRLLFIGGNGIEFRERGLIQAHQAPLAWDSRMLFTTRQLSVFDPFFGSTADLLDYMDEGCVAINFHGHGGGAIWSDNGLFRLDDVTRLSNKNRYPLILSMTCFTGAFDALTNQSLADAMLLMPDAGNHAFFGASGLGWLTNDDLLQAEIMGYLYEHPEQTVGEIIDAGKIRYLTRYYSDIAVSEVIQYNFLGDPASRFHAPSIQTALSIQPSLLRTGDTLAVSCQLPFARGLVRWQLVDSSLTVLESRSSLNSSTRVSTSFIASKSLSAGIGYVRLFALDETGMTAVHGSATFSLKGFVIDSLTVVAKGADSLLFYARIRSSAALTSVQCRVFDQVLPMSAAADHWYVSAAYHLSPEMSIMQYRITVQDENGQLHESKIYQQHVQNLANLYIDRSAVRCRGLEAPQLSVPVRNSGSGVGQRVFLRLELADLVNVGWQTVAMDSLTVPAFSTVAPSLDFAPPAGPHFIRLILDYDRDVANGFLSQSILRIQTEAFAYKPESGLLGQDSLYYDDGLTLSMPAGVFSSPGVVFIQKNSAPLLMEQSDLQAAGNSCSYRISYSKEETPVRPFTLIMPASPLGAPALYRFTPASKRWRRLGGRVVNQRLTATVSEWGEYRVLYGVDQQPPTVQVHLDGRPLKSGMLTAAEPQLSILLQDQNGIDITSGAWSITLDGATPEACAVPDSVSNANYLLLQGLVSLDAGDHHLRITARDCSGNESEPFEATWQVLADFQLQVLGNYPNPFTTHTVFAYVLTQPAEKLSLKIFTASGRMIRSINPALEGEDALPLAADYHELTWDGRDDQGYEVANGVYFYRFTAHRAGEGKEVIGKIARIR